MPDERLLEQAFERMRDRYFGKYRGIVTEVDETTMRIKATVPAVLGETATGWCTPCVPYAGNGVGFAFLPEVGSGVWIEFEAGDVSMPVWTGCFWHSGEVPPDAKAAVKAIVTVAGHKILLDDDAGSVVISDSNGNKMTLDSSGLTLERDGKKVVVSASKVDVNGGALEVM